MGVIEGGPVERGGFLSAGVRAKDGIGGTGGGCVCTCRNGGGEAREVSDRVRW